MAKVKLVYTEDGKEIGIQFFCQGCGYDHVIFTNPETSGQVWEFNRDLDKPTASPSLLNRTGSFAEPTFQDPEGIPPTRCQLYLKAGIIEFLGDCTHHLAGQNIELPEIEL